MKPSGWQYPFVQDPKTISKIIMHYFPIVPNPDTIPSSIPPEVTCFTTIDLCYFQDASRLGQSVPLFAFTWGGQQYIWTGTPQGFNEAPSYISQVLNQGLKDLNSLCDLVLIQNVDDFLLYSESKEAYEKDAICLLILSRKRDIKFEKINLNSAKQIII